MASKPTIESIDASLARWKTRLKRAVNTIDKLEKQRKRLAKKQAPQPRVITDMREITKAPAVKVTSHPVANPDNVRLTFEPVKDPVDDLAIPGFLQRSHKETVKHDAEVREAILAEQAATKTAKARGRIATMKAKKIGETKAMPLTGKAALEKIRAG